MAMAMAMLAIGTAVVVPVALTARPPLLVPVPARIDVVIPATMRAPAMRMRLGLTECAEIRAVAGAMVTLAHVENEWPPGRELHGL